MKSLVILVSTLRLALNMARVSGIYLEEYSCCDLSNFRAPTRKLDILPHHPPWLDYMLADIATITALNSMTSAALTISTWSTRLFRNELEKSQRGREPGTHTLYTIKSTKLSAFIDTNYGSWMLNRTRVHMLIVTIDSDHRLVLASIKIPNLYKIFTGCTPASRNTRALKFDLPLLNDADICNLFQDHISASLSAISDTDNVEWPAILDRITTAANEILRPQPQAPRQSIYDADIARLSHEQKELRLAITACNYPIDLLLLRSRRLLWLRAICARRKQ
uniref:AlNc14C376G11178 protein n=1 Tax=Albugo laibachii Nc14 TaxID=890382 RepID=F0WYB9_9STRA|nr:AlNc14C376G11178 [Albugo laibachii Nc14]|eukprot:CCA26471.1 AlNc14C376G11178 [Albugo laibachii Nc14]